MGNEQVKEELLESLLEVMDHIRRSLKIEKGYKEESNDEPLTDNAKELLKHLKENPELAKELFSSAAMERIESKLESLEDNSEKSLNQLSVLKRNIDISSLDGDLLLDSISKLEKDQLKNINFKERLSIELEDIEDSKEVFKEIKNDIFNYLQDEFSQNDLKNAEFNYKYDSIEIVNRDQQRGDSYIDIDLKTLDATLSKSNSLDEKGKPVKEPIHKFSIKEFDTKLKNEKVNKQLEEIMEKETEIEIER